MAGVAVISLGVFGVATASAQTTCVERPGPVPSLTATNLAELQVDATNPSLTVAMGSNEKETKDDISFTSKGRRAIGGRPSDATAEIVRWPHLGNDRLDADILVAAEPGRTGARVVLGICVTENGTFSAGRHEGTVQVYGPKFTEFSYPLIVTTKWPFYTALGILVLAIVAFAAVALLTNSLTFGFTGTKRWAASALGLAVAAGAAAATYWGSYVSNPTWGDDPGTQIIALAIAGFTAAVGGLAAVERLLRPAAGDGGDDDAVDEPEEEAAVVL